MFSTKLIPLFVMKLFISLNLENMVINDYNEVMIYSNITWKHIFVPQTRLLIKFLHLTLPKRALVCYLRIFL